MLAAALAALLLAAVPDAAPTPRDAPLRDSLSHYVAHQDTPAAERLCRERARTREEQLLCRFRLYPLTRDAAHLRDLPTEAPRGASARETALLAGLWGMRAATASALRVPTYGRRSERLLEAALARSPSDPYALLVRGQSLFYKPRTFGGDVAEAQRTFERLRAVVARQAPPGMDPWEAEVWIWMCVRRQNAAEGARLQRALLARRPPPLYRQFLTSPP